MKYEPYIHKELQDLLSVEELSLRPDPHSGRLLATLCDLMTARAEQGAELRGLRERVEEMEMSVAGGNS